MFTLNNFYKSKEWEQFRKIVIAERTDAEGFVYCELCGKPILKPYDLIVHHKIELTDINVNDYKISLNPSNMMLLHFKCHNEMHKRFGYGTAGYKPKPKKVYIVHGAPMSGKTTWAEENATKDDLIISMDRIWQMLSVKGEDKPDRLRSTAFSIRDALYDIVKYRQGKWQNAFIIQSAPRIGDRERLKARTGADEFIHIDTDKDTCMGRTLGKGSDIRNYIIEYFDSYQEG